MVKAWLVLGNKLHACLWQDKHSRFQTSCKPIHHPNFQTPWVLQSRGLWNLCYWTYPEFIHWWSKANDQTIIQRSQEFWLLSSPDCWQHFLDAAFLRVGPPHVDPSRSRWAATCFPVLSRHFLCVMFYFLFLFSPSFQILSLLLTTVHFLPLQTLPFEDTTCLNIYINTHTHTQFPINLTCATVRQLILNACIKSIIRSASIDVFC